MRTVEENRSYAAECRKVAAELPKPVDKKALELMAAAWEKVAAERERRIKESGPQD